MTKNEAVRFFNAHSPPMLYPLVQINEKRKSLGLRPLSSLEATEPISQWEADYRAACQELGVEP